MKSFATLNEVITEIHSYPADSVQRHIFALINRDVRDLIFAASCLEVTELNEEYPLFEDNVHLFEDFIGGKVVFVHDVSELEPLKIEGKYSFDRVEVVGLEELYSMALVTNNAGGDLFYVPKAIVIDNLELLSAMNRFREIFPNAD